MPRTLKLCTFYALALLLAFDVHAIAQRYLGGSTEPIAWLKVVGAFLLQAFALAAGAAYAGFLGKSEAFNAGEFSSWRIKALPIVALGVAAAFSVAMLYNGMVCGNQPLPAVRGAPSCTK
jgi:hypothetical protein